MERAQFTFYRSYYEAIQELPKKDQTAVLLAICAYALDNKAPELSGTSSAIFRLIRPTLDAGRKKAMGGHRGSPAKDETEKGQRLQKDDGKTGERDSEDSANEKEGEIEIENECSPPTPSQGKTKKRFVPPSVEEVRAYCEGRHNGIDAAMFVDSYAAKGWMIGKSQMRDWKAAVRTWEKRRREEPQLAEPPKQERRVLT